MRFCCFLFPLVASVILTQPSIAQQAESDPVSASAHDAETASADDAASPQQDAKPDSVPVTRGPVDSKEKTKPGKIDPDAPTTFTETKSGLRYRILRKSKKVKPRAYDAVEVHYKGWLGNGEIFDSSYRRGKKARFALPQVIKGWIEGLQLLGAGGMIELEIPPQLAYGRRGSPPQIPENATLHFIIELYKVTKLAP